MRALLAHPVYRLTSGLVGLLATLLITFTVFGQIPKPIGPISDYGAVLDRHGRERIEGLIADAQATYAISVRILADWQNPFPDAATLARAVLDEWGLSSEPACLLAVFIRTEGRWDHAVVGTAGLSNPELPNELTDALADLVFHKRIEEAMVTLFELIEKSESPVAAVPTDPERDGNSPIGWIAGGVLLVSAILIVVIHRRLCPRCGRILRVERAESGALPRRPHRVYYCRSCGFRRSRP